MPWTEPNKILNSSVFADEFLHLSHIFMCFASWWASEAFGTFQQRSHSFCTWKSHWNNCLLSTSNISNIFVVFSQVKAKFDVGMRFFQGKPQSQQALVLKTIRLNNPMCYRFIPNRIWLSRILQHFPMRVLQNTVRSSARSHGKNKYILWNTAKHCGNSCLTSGNTEVVSLCYQLPLCFGQSLFKFIFSCTVSIMYCYRATNWWRQKGSPLSTFFGL
jgi:hypothetical protein